MTPKLQNGLVFASGVPYKGLPDDCESVLVCDDASLAASVKGVITQRYLQVNDIDDANGAKYIYLPRLDVCEKLLDSVIEQVLGKGARLMVRCSASLEETGLFDSRFGKSPTMYLHSLGLLKNCTIAGALYLDKDDLALMRQEDASIVLTLSDDYGRGLSIPPFISYLNAGVGIRLGTGSGRYNPSHDLCREAYLLKLSLCAAMNRPDAVTDEQLTEILTGRAADGSDLVDKIYGKNQI